MKAKTNPPNKIWAVDFARLNTANCDGYLCVIVESSSRNLLSISLGVKRNASLVIEGIKQALDTGNTPEEVRFDEGITSISEHKDIEKYMEEIGVVVSCKSATEADRCIRYLRKQVRHSLSFPDAEHMTHLLQEYINCYNNRIQWPSKRENSRAYSHFHNKVGENI